MPILDHTAGSYSIAASQWVDGKITLRCRINTTNAVTSGEAFLIRQDDYGWVAHVLAATTGIKLTWLGVSEKAIAASTAALVTATDLVVGGVTDIITTALPTTGYLVTIATNTAIVSADATLDHNPGFGIWRDSSTSLTHSKECLLFACPWIHTS